MGLRINTSVGALTATRILRSTDRGLAGSVERLSTGLRINRASDDPSGLVISEKLRAQIKSMDQALRNTENGANLISTTEAALQEVSRLLIDIRESAIFAMNTGGSSPEQVEAEQDAVDQALAAIDKIANTTRFASNQLLDGTQEIRPLAVSSALSDIKVRSIQFDSIPSRTINVNVLAAATRASMDIGLNVTNTVVSGGDVTFRISGELGTQILTLGSGTTVADLMAAANLVALNTGVIMTADAMSNVYIKAINYGSTNRITLEVVAGAGTYNGTQVFQLGGTDTIATINGITATARGQRLSLTTPSLDVELNVDATSGTGIFSFSSRQSGLKFQIGEKATPNDSINVGVQSIHTAFLGMDTQTLNLGSGNMLTIGGVLASMRAGSTNDLFRDPGNALRIIDAAIDDVTDVRAFLGAVGHDFMEPNVRSLGVAMEELTKSEGAIRDLDFATETAEFTKLQIMFQAGTSVLAQANQLPSVVLGLLQ